MVWALQGRTADCKVGPRGRTNHVASARVAPLDITFIDRGVLIAVYIDPTGTVTPGGTCVRYLLF